MSDVTIFAPAPTLTVTVEGHAESDEIHIHAGGQGVWQARMLRSLGVPVTLCCVLSGETGTVLQHVLEDEGVKVAAVMRQGRASTYLHDRRAGQRVVIAEEEAEPFDRHVLDELYGVTIREAVKSRLTILSGPSGESVLSADTYRRLASDLRAAGVTVVIDLAGERLDSALKGGVDVVKVSDEELHADGRLSGSSREAIISAMRALRGSGADAVVVTRAEKPLLLLDANGVYEVSAPEFEVMDSRGAGDSLTAGVVAALHQGESLRTAITLGAAAGALNVTRHGLGTGDPDAIVRLRERVRVRTVSDKPPDGDNTSSLVSPDDLAALAEREDTL